MKKVFLIIIFSLLFITSNDVLAQNMYNCPTGTILSVSSTGSLSCQSTNISGGGSGSSGSTVQTALGPIPTDPKELVKWILGWSIAMGGGIAFLLSLWGGITIILAGGNPEKINEGKEIITSAVSGLLFIIFSVFLLRFIGVDILGILTK